MDDLRLHALYFSARSSVRIACIGARMTYMR